MEVEAAIRARADVNARNDYGSTALMEAILNYIGDTNTLKIINILLDAGADVNVRDAGGRRALDYALEREEFMKTGAFKIIREKTEGVPRLEYSTPHKEYFVVFG